MVYANLAEFVCGFRASEFCGDSPCGDKENVRYDIILCRIMNRFEVYVIKYTAAMLLLGLFVIRCFANGIQSENIVGYETEMIRHGHNTIVMPENVAFKEHAVKDVLRQLKEGDRVLYKDGFQNSWGLVLQGDDGQLHAYEGETDKVVDECPLPVLGGRQVLTVYRESYDVSNVSVSGAYDETASAFVSDAAPLDKIRLDKDIVDSLTVTITNKVTLPFKTVISKQFDIVLKDGRRLRVKVDPRSSLIVDAESELPVNIGSEEIANFELIKDDGKASGIQKAEKKDITKIAANVASKSRGYNIQRTLREAVIGSLWDGSDVQGSIVRWMVVTLALGCIAKVGDLCWTFFFGLLVKIFICAVRKFWLVGYWMSRFCWWVKRLIMSAFE